jgi:hypothetical protein
MEKLYLLLIVLIPALSMSMVIIAKVTIPGPVAMVLFGTLFFSFASLKFSKDKHKP